MDKEHKAIERIKMASEISLHYYGKPLVCTYSGGKDSDVMLEMFKRSGVPFEVHHSHTTADAPQTVYHIREVFKNLELQGVKCTIQMPTYKGENTSMWKLIPQKLMPPTRLVRYCCAVLKETGCANRFIATGVRWSESTKRKEWGNFSDPNTRLQASDEIMLMSDNDIKRKITERCELKGKMVVNPIIDFTDYEIWDFYRNECPYHNSLYECGYERVGCVGCPIAGKKRWREFADFPKYKNLYIHAFDRMLKERIQRGKETKWRTGEEVFLWWMEDDNVPGQMSIEDFIN